MPGTQRIYVSIYTEGGERMGGIPVEMSDQCATCVHKQRNLSCAAYPDVIPAGILDGGHDHRLPYPGDGGIRYELHPGVKAPRGETFSPPPRRWRPAAVRNQRRRIRAQLRSLFGRGT